MIYKIKPAYRIRNALKQTLFAIAFVLVVLNFIIEDVDGLIFFACIKALIGLFITLFSSTNTLTIDINLVTFESKNIIDGLKSIKIDLADVKKVRFLKRQMLWLGGRNPLADADAQTLYYQNRIGFSLNDNTEKVIKQVGNLEEFKKAFLIVETKVLQRNS